MSTRWTVWDSQGIQESIEAATAEEAAEEYRDLGDWNLDAEGAHAFVLNLWVIPEGSEDSPEQFSFVMEPPIPECTGGSHRFVSPHNLVGGCVENPGVFGGPHGGITTHSVCAHCGLERTHQSRGSLPGGGGRNFPVNQYEMRLSY